jgi:hypothetical protein
MSGRNKALKGRAKLYSQIEVHKIMAVLTLIYGSETWTQIAQKNCLTSLAGYSLLDKREVKILENNRIFLI